jgi:hypothetical protein
MPRSPLLSRVISTLSALPALIVAALVGVGCGPSNGVGRPCDVGTTPPASTSGQVMTLSSPALECPSRICLLPSGGSTSGTGALCTAGCDSDADCEDGERGVKGDPADSRCKSGFACMWPTTVGAFACQKMCVCRDFVGEPTGGFQKPASCP